MAQNERNAFPISRLFVNEVDPGTIKLGAEVMERVESTLLCAPIKLVSPIGKQLFEVIKISAPIPCMAWCPRRPPGITDALSKLRQRLLRNRDREWFNGHPGFIARVASRYYEMWRLTRRSSATIGVTKLAVLSTIISRPSTLVGQRPPCLLANTFGVRFIAWLALIQTERCWLQSKWIHCDATSGTRATNTLVQPLPILVEGILSDSH